MRQRLGKFKVYVIYLRNLNPSHAHVQPPRGMLRPIHLTRAEGNAAYGLKNKLGKGIIYREKSEMV